MHNFPSKFTPPPTQDLARYISDSTCAPIHAVSTRRRSSKSISPPLALGTNSASPVPQQTGARRRPADLPPCPAGPVPPNRRSSRIKYRRAAAQGQGSLPLHLLIGIGRRSAATDFMGCPIGLNRWSEGEEGMGPCCGSPRRSGPPGGADGKNRQNWKKESLRRGVRAREPLSRSRSRIEPEAQRSSISLKGLRARSRSA